jgi:DNA primase
MRPHHLRYLERRGFDSDLIEREWGVLGTGPCAYLDGIDYRFRLLIPVVWDGREVSFQARDVTGRSDLRYASCPVDREVRHHKHILYGRQERWGRTGIVVEGVTDAWRFGPVACATFGIAYTTEQVRLIARAFERVAIVFDAERQAQERARRLAAQLHQLGNERPVVVSLGEGVDPGSMGQDDADHLVRELTR